jgi:hypothetical protein
VLVSVAEASQITGSLLVFALLVVPAVAAQRCRPAWIGLALSVARSRSCGRAGDRLLVAVPRRILDLGVAFGVYGAAHATPVRCTHESGGDRRRGSRPGNLSRTCSSTLLAGTAIAAASGLVGFVVLRSQVFSADALSHVRSPVRWRAAIGVDAPSGCSSAPSRWRSGSLGGGAPTTS